MDVEDHVDCSELHGCFWVACCIVEYMGEVVDGGLCSFGLGGGKVAEGGRYCSLYGSGVEEWVSN